MLNAIGPVVKKKPNLTPFLFFSLFGRGWLVEPIKLPPDSLIKPLLGGDVHRP
jgi:hypothetical protein